LDRSKHVRGVRETSQWTFSFQKPNPMRTARTRLFSAITQQPIALESHCQHLQKRLRAIFLISTKKFFASEMCEQNVILW